MTSKFDKVHLEGSTESELQFKIHDTVRRLRVHHVEYKVEYEAPRERIYSANVFASKRQLLMEG